MPQTSGFGGRKRRPAGEIIIPASVRSLGWRDTKARDRACALVGIADFWTTDVWTGIIGCTSRL